MHRGKPSPLQRFVIVVVFAALVSAADVARASVTWISAARAVRSGWVRFPLPSGSGQPTVTETVQQHPGEGLFQQSIGATAQDTNITFVANAITGVGTASWTPRVLTTMSATYFFGRSEISASFTTDEPTPYHSTFAIGGNTQNPLDYRLTSPTLGQTIVINPGVQSGLLPAGTWSYTLFIGPNSSTVGEENGGGGTITFDISFHVPEPSCAAAALAALVVLVRRRRRAASSCAGTINPSPASARPPSRSRP